MTGETTEAQESSTRYESHHGDCWHGARNRPDGTIVYANIPYGQFAGR